MIAKREVSRLYEDIKKVPYVVLFNPGLSALKLWRSVDVLRRVDEFLRDEQTQKEGKERLVAIHGNRVLLFLVFRELTPTIFTADDADEELSRVQAIAQKCLEQLTTEITKNYSQSYPGQLFKNITKCKEIASAISIGR
jgi:hypothetical protein